MFYGATSFNQNLGAWNVDTVTDCNKFSYDTPQWRVSKPVFKNCTPYTVLNQLILLCKKLFIKCIFYWSIGITEKHCNIWSSIIKSNSRGLQQTVQSSIKFWWLTEGSIIFNWYSQQCGQSK